MTAATYADALDEVLVERYVSGRARAVRHSREPERIEAIRRLAERGYSDAEIGERVTMTRAAVTKARQRHGIPAGVLSSREASATSWRTALTTRRSA